MVLLSESIIRVILLLCLLGIIALLNGSGVEARIRRYKWEVKYEYRSPDCVKKRVITINGQTPGPTIRAQLNDTIIVELTNSLSTENVAIHWHGIRQIGTPWFNGTEGVTQFPILPGTTFKYQFVVDTPGTYLYHAHSGMQREAGLYGSINVALPDGQSEPFTCDYDRNIILDDWYHKSTYEQAFGLSSIPFEWVGEPQSLLIHERGKFNCSSLTIPALDTAIERHYTWEVTYQYKSLDCYKKLAIAINGSTPGPTISAVQGDTIVVDVINNLLMENVAIHWHGIRQRGTPWSDGTDGVTQCAIMPGDTYRYTFVVDRAGTYMYHSHYGMQREAGLYGMINVSLPVGDPEPFIYDLDRGIILSDWYHRTAYEQSTGLSSIPYEWIGEPQSLLINGRGNFSCSGLAPSVCNSTNPQCSPFTLTVISGKTYRLRLASLTSLSSLSFQIEGHEMTVVEADGQYVEPFVTKNLFIYSGETYSVLVTANQDPSRNYWISINVVGRKPKTPNGLAIFNYYPNHFLIPPTNPPSGPIWNDKHLRINQSLTIKARQGFIVNPPKKPDRIIVLLNTQNKINGYIRWSLNNVSHSFPTTPYLIALKENMTDIFDPTSPPEDYDSANFDIYSVANNTNANSSTSIYRLQFNSTVDIILQNANTMRANVSETHPWHLHGHDFWVLGYGEGKFNLSGDTEKYNLVDPIMKNTVPLHPYGWTALRFQADNPGVWLFHCHIEAHLFLGMFVVFESGMEQVGNIPKANYGCGKTKDLFKP